MKDVVQWTTAAPLWAEAAASADEATRALFRRPAILRFATDAFMDDFMATVETDPARLREFVVRPETWRGVLPPPESPVLPARGFGLKLARLRLAAERKLAAAQSQTRSQIVVAGARQAAGAAGGEAGANDLKLYQPAHQRFYLVASCLVCRVAGLPDHALDTAREERATFVLRRLFDKRTGRTNLSAGPGECDEYAFVSTPQGHVWKRVSATNDAAGQKVEGEEHLPLFAVNYTEEDGRRRRLFAGIIPVGKREAYMSVASVDKTPAHAADAEDAPGDGNGGTTTNGNGGTTKKTARKILFRTQVTEPWKNLILTASAAARAPTAYQTEGDPFNTAPDPKQVNRTMKATREQIQTVSWLVLLDLSKYLKQYLAPVWDAILDPAKEADIADPNQQALLQAFKDTAAEQALADSLRKEYEADGVTQVDLPETVAASLYDALKSIAAPAGTWGDWEQKLNSVTGSYDRLRGGATDALRVEQQKWPAFLFPLADPLEAAPLPPEDDLPDPETDSAVTPADSEATRIELARVDRLAALVVKALPADPSPATPQPAAPVNAKAPYEMRDGLFVIRCVFERPACGPLDPPLLSEPTEAFQLAGFFDPDAPARPIRIGLPVDTTPAGLRKFDKNTAFMMSDVLCGQVNRVKGLTLGDLVRSVLPWPLHKDLSVPDAGPCGGPGLEFGMMCSLSIPIITICALLLLMIIVSLLDIIFRWMPFFIMCLPIPHFKAKD